MRLVELLDKDKKEYNQFVAGSPSGSFLQSWEWGEWQASLGYRVKRFALENDENRWLASAQIIFMALPFKKVYLYSPYGPVVGIGLLSANLEFFIKEIRNLFPDALFLRLEPLVQLEGLTAFAVKSTNIQPGVTMQIELNKPEAELASAMHPKTRYNIKVAQRHEVAVQSELIATPGHGLYVQEFINLITETQLRQNYRGHSEKYYYKLLDFFSLHNQQSDLKIRLYKALLGRKLLACGIMVDFGRVRMYLYGGSSAEHREAMAPYLLHWQAIMDAKSEGLFYYDLGGSEVSSGGERGFTRFKRGFGGRVLTFAGCYDVLYFPWQYRIYNRLRQINRNIKKLSGK